ncbi:uncharacterized protein LOC110845343 isoform X2 [Folsomia candida]|uniref:Uncharacterized protein n=1 Tax=Folsomia candida TaxID=158441 RepID=A0A226EQ51_FOLCA|nr:uncharacterized protein LOC110845343 isoform X2 [Folsomia candida]OXA59400.1 hypothetical protein Fcan01_04858 [Folsomia candida]
MDKVGDSANTRSKGDDQKMTDQKSSVAIKSVTTTSKQSASGSNTITITTTTRTITGVKQSCQTPQNLVEKVSHADDTATMPGPTKSFGNTCKLRPYLRYELRKDQNISMLNSTKYKRAVICAPSWMHSTWKNFHLKSNLIPHDIGLQIVGALRSEGVINCTHFLDSLPKNSLIKLQLFSRNEQYNVTGAIKRGLYSEGIPQQVILSLKDLVRQTIIVGVGQTTHYGGYKTTSRPQNGRVYICDLSALQFQNKLNTGRLVLLSEHGTIAQGVLDEEIFENVVGQKRLSQDKINSIFPGNERYVPCRSKVFGGVYFDTVAYKRFVATDVVLAGLALNMIAEKDNGQGINFKFLKYGSGFFAGDFSAIIEKNILNGVLDGLESLFGRYDVSCIKQVELPFYENTERGRVSQIQETSGRPIVFSMEDALRHSKPGLVTATTNCGDPHAVLGNEMGYQSVDAAIAENLQDKGNQFCPLLNANFRQCHFDVK